MLLSSVGCTASFGAGPSLLGGGGGERPSLALCDSATWWLCRAARASDA